MAAPLTQQSAATFNTQHHPTTSNFIRLLYGHAGVASCDLVIFDSGYVFVPSIGIAWAVGAEEPFACAVQYANDGQTYGSAYALFKYEAAGGKGGKKK